MITPISERQADITLLLQRVLFSLAVFYLTVGAALHLNAFIQNGIDIGLPFSSIICPSVVILGGLFSIFIMLGFFWTPSVVCMLFISFFYGFFFFAGSLNKVNLTGVLFSVVILSGFLVFGPGKISLTWRRRQKRNGANKRISFR